MQFAIPKYKRRDISEWHWRFAWFPVRISESKIVWWELYYCRLLCVAEGGWAGGDQWRWQYVEHGKSDIWDGPLICN